MSEIKICPKCGTEVFYSGLGEQKFCQNCGHKLNTTETETNTLIGAYKSMFKKYAKFNGRSRRSEYWYAYLANVLVMVAAYFCFVPAVLDINNYGEPTPLSAILMGLAALFIFVYCFAIIIPLWALTVRRLHDTGKSGWYLLLGFIPYIGSIALFVFMVLDSQPGDNIYGPNPKNII